MLTLNTPHTNISLYCSIHIQTDIKIEIIKLMSSRNVTYILPNLNTHANRAFSQQIFFFLQILSIYQSTELHYININERNCAFDHRDWWYCSAEKPYKCMDWFRYKMVREIRLFLTRPMNCSEEFLGRECTFK